MSNDRMYKSFEQFKAEAFPRLASRKVAEEFPNDYRKVGANLADSIFDQLVGDDSRSQPEPKVE